MCSIQAHDRPITGKSKYINYYTGTGQNNEDNDLETIVYYRMDHLMNNNRQKI